MGEMKIDTKAQKRCGKKKDLIGNSLLFSIFNTRI